jgi:transposase
VALEAVKGERTVSELASRIRCASDDDPSVEEGIARRRVGHLRARRPKKKAEIDEETGAELHAKIGELAVANDFLSRKLKPWTGK